MKLIRLKIAQNKASYAREEMVQMVSTYLLPPFSTIVGALCNACCENLDLEKLYLSVQGSYETKNIEMHIRNVHLNHSDDCRGILIYYPNPFIFEGGIKVAKVLTHQNSSFTKKQNIEIYHDKLLDLYINLKKEQKELAEQKRNSMNKELFKSQQEKLKKESSHFQSLIKLPSTREFLYGVNLVIHLKVASNDISKILSETNNFTCLGRSEDFIELKECKLVEAEHISSLNTEMIRLKNNNLMYINADRYSVYNSNAVGTVFYVSKKYKIHKEKRVFEKIPCLLTSNFKLNETFLIDEDGYYIDLN